MAVFSEFDNIEETCTVEITDPMEQICLQTALLDQANKYQAQILDPNKETDEVEINKRDKFYVMADRVFNELFPDNVLELVTKQELNSWSTALNDFYVINKPTLDPEETDICIIFINDIDIALRSIDRKT